MAIKDLMGQLRMEYEYVTEPPLFADMGIYRGIMNKTGFLIDTTSKYDHINSHFKIILN